MAWNPFRRRTKRPIPPVSRARPMASIPSAKPSHPEPSKRISTTSRRRKMILAGTAIAGIGLLGVLGRIIGLGPRPHPPLVTEGNGRTRNPPRRYDPLPRITPERTPVPTPERETREQREARIERERIAQLERENNERVQKLLDARKKVPFFDAKNSWDGLQKFSSVYTKKDFQYELDANGFPIKPAWVVGGAGDFQSTLRDGSIVALKRVNVNGDEETTYMMFHEKKYFYLPSNGQGGKIGNNFLNDFLENYKDGNAQVVGVFNPTN